MYPSELKYDKEHEWVRVEGDVAVIGISHFAQHQLGEVVYVDLPSEGDSRQRRRDVRRDRVRQVGLRALLAGRRRDHQGELALCPTRPRPSTRSRTAVAG
jgi:hypothetical protein